MSLLDLLRQDGEVLSLSDDERIYFEKAQLFYKTFGTEIPRETMPSYITDADIIKAIDICLAEQRGDIMRVLGVAKTDGNVLY